MVYVHKLNSLSRVRAVIVPTCSILALDTNLDCWCAIFHPNVHFNSSARST